MSKAHKHHFLYGKNTQTIIKHRKWYHVLPRKSFNILHAIYKWLIESFNSWTPEAGKFTSKVDWASEMDKEDKQERQADKKKSQTCIFFEF